MLKSRIVPQFMGAVVLAALSAAPAAAQVSLTTMGSPYTQNFNTLASAGTSSTTPTGWVFVEAGGGADTLYTAGTGSATTGDTYSAGAAASAERAFGSLQSGSNTPTIGASFTNNTGATITSLAIAYTGEQWRLGNPDANIDRLDFQMSTNATSLSTGTWVDHNALDFASPTATPGGALDGNAAANRTALSFTITGLSLANGATFWIRFLDFNVTSSDDLTAVDDFSLTPTGAPPAPNLSIDDVSTSEGNAGSSNYTFTVTLSAPAGPGGVTFDLSTQDGTAVQPGDYAQTIQNGMTIAAGNTTATFSVPVNGDTAVEANETFFVNVTNVVGATVTDGQGQGTIVNDDVLPTVSVADSSATEADVTRVQMVFTLTLSAPSATPIDVTFATSDGTASGSADYREQTRFVTIAAGDTTRTFDISVWGDTLDESDETFTVTITSAPGATIGDGVAVGTINDNDGAPQISISDAGVVEGDSGRANNDFAVTLSNPSASSVSVDYSITPGTATPSADYRVQAGTLVFATGETQKLLTIVAWGDTTDEGNETFTVELSSAVNAAILDSAGLGTITDDDAAPTINVTNPTVTEGSVRVNADFTVSLTNASSSSIVINYATQDVTAQGAYDYRVTSGSLTFLAGQTSKIVTVAVWPDTLAESDETFDLNLTGSGGGTAVGTIQDDGDTTPLSVSIADAQDVNEGDTGYVMANFTLSLNGPSQTAVTVDWATADGTAVNSYDYRLSSGTVTFQPGELNKVISVRVWGDLVVESTESFVVNLTNPVGAAVADGTASANILDNEP